MSKTTVQVRLYPTTDEREPIRTPAFYAEVCSDLRCVILTLMENVHVNRYPYLHVAYLAGMPFYW